MRFIGFISLLLISSGIRSASHASIIVTAAGGGRDPLSVGSPAGIAVAENGDLLIADSFDHAILRADSSGKLAVVAGGNGAGFSGDGGLAVKAQLKNPTGVTPDGAGGFLIADSGNNRIRRVYVGGVIATIAGNGEAGFSGDGEACAKAQFNNPTGVSSDGAGGYLIADSYNGRIRRIDASGYISTVAGNGDMGAPAADGILAVNSPLSSPIGAISDGAGGFLIADSGHYRIRHVNAQGIISTVAGTGTPGFSNDDIPATTANLHYPASVAMDGAGGFYIADADNDRVCHVNAKGIFTRVAGRGAPGFTGDGVLATETLLNQPRGVVSDGAGGFYVADTDNSRIRRVDAKGIITTFAGNGAEGFYGDGGPAVNAVFNNPSGAASDGAGGFYVADTDNQRIRRVDANGIVTTVAGSGNVGWGEGGYSGDGGLASQALLNRPSDVEPDGAGGFLIVDSCNQRIRRVDAKGIITTIAGNGELGISPDGGLAAESRLSYPAGAISDGAGGFLIADAGNHRIVRVDAKGILTTVAGNGQSNFTGDGGLAAHSMLSSPQAMASDGAGGFYIVDAGNERIRRIDASGIITTVAGNGSSQVFSGDGGAAIYAHFVYPTSVASDGTGGFLIADPYSQRIRRVDAYGKIESVAGSGNTGWDGGGFSGDGGSATQAFLNQPSDVAPDGAGGFLIADTSNNRIRRLTLDLRLNGDVNGDGKVDIGDATLILRFMVGLQSPDTTQLAAADMNGDGKITLQDATLCLKKAIGA